MLIIIIIVGCAKITIFSKDTFHPDKRPVAVKIMHLDYSRLGADRYCQACSAVLYTWCGSVLSLVQISFLF